MAKKQYGYFQGSRGHKSSKRLIGIPAGFVGIFNAVFLGVSVIFTTVDQPWVSLSVSAVLFFVCFICFGLATWENVKDILRAIRGK